MSAAKGGILLSRAAQLLSFCAMISVWLVAGTFFAFSDFVMPGLAQMDPEAGILAMQAMNVAVEQRIFSFIVSSMMPLCILIMMFWAFLSGPRSAAIGALVFIAGAAPPTLIGNIPLNDSLAEMSAQDPATEIFWAALIPDWVFYNNIRLAACLVAGVCFGFATFRTYEKGPSL